jgi:hypothetical protein
MKWTKKLGRWVGAAAAGAVTTASVTLATHPELAAIIPPKYVAAVAIAASLVQLVGQDKAFDRNPDGTPAAVPFDPDPKFSGSAK